MFVRSAVLTACIVAATAAAAEGRAKPRPLWATVNVCNTPKSPHQMGVRAQMWGDGTRERIPVVIRIQPK